MFYIKNIMQIFHDNVQYTRHYRPKEKGASHRAKRLSPLAGDGFYWTDTPAKFCRPNGLT